MCIKILDETIRESRCVESKYLKNLKFRIFCLDISYKAIGWSGLFYVPEIRLLWKRRWWVILIQSTTYMYINYKYAEELNEFFSQIANSGSVPFIDFVVSLFMSCIIIPGDSMSLCYCWDGMSAWLLNSYMIFNWMDHCFSTSLSPVIGHSSYF